MDEEYSTSPRTTASDAPKVQDGGNANAIYGAKPQTTSWKTSKKGEEFLPQGTALFKFGLEGINMVG